jgi:hypothetical protein
VTGLSGGIIIGCAGGVQRPKGKHVPCVIQFGLTELELFGAAITNDELREILLRQGYQTRTEQCPDELGGGTVEILTRVYPVRR